MMQTRNELAAGIGRSFEDAAKWFAGRPDSTFEVGPGGRWTEGQVLDHLILSTKPLNMAYRLPRIVLRWKFGVAKSGSESRDAMIARYEAALAKGGKAPKPFVPPAVPVSEKARLIESLRKEGQRLVEAAGLWSEAGLDKYVLPHPLIGNLTLRNFLEFADYHVQHHLDILKRDY
jgi:hypothetical protein